MMLPEREGSCGIVPLFVGCRLPEWLPDETLFSWCSRYHQMSVNGLAAATCLQLFGDRRAGCAHDLPCRIDRLVARTGGALGDAMAIIRDRTLLPYYWPFRGQTTVDDALAALRGPGIGSLKYRLGLLTSGLDAAHPLKACPSCMSVDLHSFGVAYWHRVHQLPAVLVCPTHGDPLLVSPMKTQQRSRFQWILPDNACLERVIGIEDVVRSVKARCQLQSLARLAACEVNMQPASLTDPPRLAETFLTRLAELGFASATGRISWCALMRDVEERLRPLAGVDGIGHGSVNAGGSKTSISRMLSARGLTHPTRYLSWVSWYFDSWEAFVAAYEHAGNAPDAGAERRPGCGTDVSMEEGDRDAIATSHDLSLPCLGADVTDARRRAGGVRRRPKKLKGGLRERLIAGLATGRDKADLARAIGVSIVTVTRVLLEEPGLGDTWHRVRFERCRTRARNEWMNRMRQSAGLTATAMRKLSAGSYGWLYRHDHEWLAAVMAAGVPTTLRGNHSGVRMLKRDVELSVRIRRTAAALAETRPAAAIELDDLVRHLPELKSRINRLAGWPLAARALDAVLRPDPGRSGDAGQLWGPVEDVAQSGPEVRGSGPDRKRRGSSEP